MHLVNCHRNSAPSFTPARTTCDELAELPGKTFVLGVFGAAIPGVGGILGGGLFVNRHGIGLFRTTGGGFGYELGFSTQGGFYNRLVDLRGVNLNVSVSSESVAGTASFSSGGALVGLTGGTGGRVGGSFSATNTELRSCHRFH